MFICSDIKFLDAMEDEKMIYTSDGARRINVVLKPKTIIVREVKKTWRDDIRDIIDKHICTEVIEYLAEPPVIDTSSCKYELINMLEFTKKSHNDAIVLYKNGKFYSQL
jgi:hypothetical protein